jgi:hypothetical protein
MDAWWHSSSIADKRGITRGLRVSKKRVLKQHDSTIGLNNV